MNSWHLLTLIHTWKIYYNPKSINKETFWMYHNQLTCDYKHEFVYRPSAIETLDEWKENNGWEQG